MDALISGDVSEGFGSVAEAFAAALAGNRDMGAALCVYLDGRPVVDLWGGTADARSGAPWTRETLNVLFSCTKGLMSILAAQLVAEGRLDYDAPVSHYWPEFEQAGKAETKVRHLLSHRAGPLRAARPPDDRGHPRLGRHDPRPGGAGTAVATRPGLRVPRLTHGWLVGEVIRRVTGKSVGPAIRGCRRRPARSRCVDRASPARRTARVSYLTVGDSLARQVAADGEETWGTLATTLGGALPGALAGPDDGFNDPRLWEAEIPGAGGIADARSLARIWSATVCETAGVRLLDERRSSARPSRRARASRSFAVPPPWPRWGMGFQLDSPARRYLTAARLRPRRRRRPGRFRGTGAEARIRLCHQPDGGVGDNRATSIIDALRAVVAARAVERSRPGGRPVVR